MNNENLKQCIYCSKMININESFIVEENGYCCADCLNENCFYCVDCETYHDKNELKKIEIYDENSDVVKNVCDTAAQNYYYCDFCYKYYDYNLNLVNDSNNYCCHNCIENNEHFFQCEICQEFFSDDYAERYDFQDLNGDDHLCCACCNEENVCCGSCNQNFYEDDVEFVESCDEHFCLNCVEELQKNIKNKRLNYHGFSNWQAYFSENEKMDKIPFFMGVELEVDTEKWYSENEVNEICKNINSKINSICECDGSLNRQTGIEIITHPSSLKYYYEHYNDYKSTFEMLLEKEYLSHDLEQCGLHIHVTRPTDDVIDKILVVMEHYKNEIIKFSRRTKRQLNDYCAFLSDFEAGEEENYKTLYYIKKNENKNTKRYLALNLTNDNTIEFRIFRGTLNINTFYSCLEFVHNLVYLCTKENDLSNITWKKLTKGKYVSKYVNEKSILTNKIIYDNSDLIKLKIERDNKIKNKIFKFVRNELIKAINKSKNFNNLSKESDDEIYNKVHCLKKDNAFYENFISTIRNSKNNGVLTSERLISDLRYFLSYQNESELKSNILNYLSNFKNGGGE